MIVEIYVVMDTKVGAFLTPLFFRSRGEAVRAFSSACQDEQHAFFKHRGDYRLFYLGKWDDGSGRFETYDPEFVIGGDQVG